MARIIYLDEPSGKYYIWKDGQFIEFKQPIQDGPPSEQQTKEMEKHQRQQAKAEQEQEKNGQQGQAGDEGQEQQGQAGDNSQQGQDQPEQSQSGSQGPGKSKQGQQQDDGQDQQGQSGQGQQGQSGQDQQGQSNTDGQQDTSSQGSSGQQGDGQPSSADTKGTAPDSEKNRQQGNGQQNSNTENAADELIQKMQELEDKLNNGEDITKDVEDLVDQAKKMADQLKDKLSPDMQDELEDAKGALDDAMERSRRMQKIKDTMSDPKSKEGIKSDNIRMKDKEAQKKRELAKQAAEQAKEQAKKEGRYFEGDLRTFEQDIEEFMEGEVGEIESPTWARRNRRYTSTDFIMPGTRLDPDEQVPTIGVYFDQSASWGSDDVRRGKKALASLFELEDEGKIQLELKYFANHVHTDAASAAREGGTRAGSEIIQDIVDSDYDNVIIMTDSDPSAYGSPNITVDGGVFYLWKDGSVAREFRGHIKGEKGTREYSI